MTSHNTLISKVLVLDNSPPALEHINHFCTENNLQPLKVREENLLAVLRSNVDLGGIMMAEDLVGKPREGIELGHQIHKIRPELPLFLRCESAQSLAALSGAQREPFACTYTLENIDALKDVIETSIFSLVYPAKLVSGIAEMTLTSLQSQFKGLQVRIETPCIVRDRLIFGEIFTLIPVETNWCRGYMTLQAEEAPLLALVKSDKTHIAQDEGDDFRNLNGILGEITNLIWGAFKNRYSAIKPIEAHLAQVPIVINHMHRYISFGSVNPQLCFKCVLTDPGNAALAPLVIYQRFAFNLNWSPEDFHENDQSLNHLVAAGELEFF
ncbi:chemotaxis protein CheX [Curvibacter sp. CHRR-16]|uniref:chemotaxis protein CheX n=1 Tax=Curvibacter sp. CHRR-16 TaxID=2835872 RepID=UPI00202394C9|nr:chemotaxis protein CheX [Curvibacter sp. CHRR-16]